MHPHWLVQSLDEIHPPDDDAQGFAPYLISRHCIDEQGELSLAAGTKPDKSTKVTPDDTFMFGSGTKPFTAALTLKLAEEGKLSLDDPAQKHVDPVLKAMSADPNLHSMAAMLGPQAAEVTVGQVIRMQSGIQDFDVPACDNPVLENGQQRHSPLEWVKCLTQQFNTSETFVCKPGTCTMYSSTNYVFAGLVLLGASVDADKIAAAGADAWTLLDQTPVLRAADATGRAFANSQFMDTGALKAHLTVPGTTHDPSHAGEVLDLHEQDASVLGWTTGNMVSPALEVARFYHALLVTGSVVSADSLKSMERFTPLDTGWAKGSIQYGAGLTIQGLSPETRNPPTLDQDGAYVGHGGDSYGFLSENGHFPKLNATISAIANTDLDLSFVHETFACRVYEVIAKVKTGQAVDLKCRTAPQPGAKYVCKRYSHYGSCQPSAYGSTTYSDCLASC